VIKKNSRGSDRRRGTHTRGTVGNKKDSQDGNDVASTSVNDKFSSEPEALRVRKETRFFTRVHTFTRSYRYERSHRGTNKWLLWCVVNLEVQFTLIEASGARLRPALSSPYEIDSGHCY